MRFPPPMQSPCTFQPLLYSGTCREVVSAGESGLTCAYDLSFSFHTHTCISATFPESMNFCKIWGVLQSSRSRIGYWHLSVSLACQCSTTLYVADAPVRHVSGYPYCVVHQGQQVFKLRLDAIHHNDRDTASDNRDLKQVQRGL